MGVKIGLGLMLMLVGQCREAVVAKTPAERAREMMEGLARGEYNALRRACHAVERTMWREVQQARPVRALRQSGEAAARAARVAERCERSVRKAAEFALVKLPERVERAWEKLMTAIQGEEYGRQAEI
jgi:hypothetical protein